MKKYVYIIVLASLLLLSACGNSRDLSTPSSRLVGHWKVKYIRELEYYFGEIDEETGKGTYAEYEAKEGSLSKGTYRVISETPEGEDITIIPMLFGYEDMPSILSNLLEMDIKIAEDGLSAKMMDFTVEYIDDKTEYEPEK